MRIWDIAPGYLDRKRLLGEHRELHGLANIITLGKKGYANHPETRRWVGYLPALIRRHDLLVAEMQVRGYDHRSPLPPIAGTDDAWPETYIDPPASQLALLAKKMAGENSMRIPMPRNAQQLWAHHKYSVMAHAPRLYRETGPLVAEGRHDDIASLAGMLVAILRQPPEPGHVANALQHMWGHLDWQGEAPARNPTEMLCQIQRQTMAEREPYLLASTALSELAAWLG